MKYEHQRLASMFIELSDSLSRDSRAFRSLKKYCATASAALVLASLGGCRKADPSGQFEKHTESPASSLIKGLSYGDQTVRTEAFSQLQGTIEISQYRNALARLLSDSKEDTRNKAYELLESLGSDIVPALPELRRQLSIGSTRTREAAVQLIAGVSTKAASAAPELTAGLGDTSPVVRVFSAQALFEQGASEGRLFPALYSCLKENEEIASRAERILRSFKTNSPHEARQLLSLLRNTSSSKYRVRASNILAAWSPKDPATINTLGNLLDHVDPGVRSSASYVLGAVGPSAHPALPALVNALYDPEMTIRINAAEAISKMGENGAFARPALKNAWKLASSEDSSGGSLSTFESTIDNALARIGDYDISASRYAIMHLQDRRPRVRQCALGTLCDLQSRGRIHSILQKELAEDVSNLLRDVSPNVRYGAASLLITLGTAAKSTVPDLKLAIKRERFSDVKQELAKALLAVQG